MRLSTRCHGSCEDVQAAAQHFPGRALVSIQLEAAHAAPVRPFRQRFGSFRSAVRAVLRRAGRGNPDERNAGAISLAFQIVEEFPPALLRNRQVRAPLPPGLLRSMLRIFSASTAMKLQVLTIRSARRWSSCRPASAIRSSARASASFFFPRLFDPRLLRDTARCFLRIALRTARLDRRCMLPPSDIMAKVRMPASNPTGPSSKPVRTSGSGHSNTIPPAAPCVPHEGPEGDPLAAAPAGSRTASAAGPSSEVHPGGPRREFGSRS